MSKKLTFSLDNIEEVQETEQTIYEKAKKSRFAKVKIRLFGTGENAHTEPVDLETLKRSADSAYDIPLIAELNPYRGNSDFGGHGVLTGKQFSFGFIKESEDNPIVFEKDESTDKTFITLTGLIWKKYFENIVDILMNRDNETEVSVELEELQGEESPNGKLKLHQFVLEAVTFLGKVTTAACKGAMAKLSFSDDDAQNFEEDKELYIKENFENRTIEISNNIETAISDYDGIIPLQESLKPIMKANNRNSLLNEMYLSFENMEDTDKSILEAKYPHHAIKDGKLVLHIKGVQSAFEKLSKEGKFEGEAREHLLRHYKTLGLNAKNFEEFGLSKEQFNMYFSEDFRKEETMLDEKVVGEQVKEENTSTDESTVVEQFSTDEVPNTENTETVDAQESSSEDKNEDKEENNEPQTNAEETVKEEEVPEGHEAETTEDESKEMKFSEEKFSELMEENSKLRDSIEKMSDYNELKLFKETTLKREAELAEMTKMSEVMTSLTQKNVDMSEQTKNELMQKRQEFENIDAWSNYVKAYVFDNCKFTGDEDIVRIDIVNPNNNRDKSNSNSIWDELDNK